MSESNLPPQPPEGWQDNQATTPVPPAPPAPQVPNTAPTQVIPPAPASGQFGAQQPSFGTAPQQPGFGGPAQPSFGGAPAQPPFGGAPAQPPFGSAPGAPGTPGFGGQNNAGGFGGNGLPPYGGGPGNNDGSNRKNLIWIIVAAVAALAIAGAAIWAFTAGPFAAKDDKDTTASDPDKDSDKDSDKDKDKDKKPKVDSGAAAVEAFLEALADGDVKTANSFLSKKIEGAYGDEDVVAASLKAAPITDIVVEGTSDYSITGTFLVGDEEISMDFSTTKSGKNYKISDYSFGDLNPSDQIIKLKPLINGEAVELKSTDGAAFPIQYEFTSSNDRITLVGTTKFIPFDYTASLWDIEFELTPEAETDIRAAVRTALEACLTEKTLASSCGMDVPATLDGGETVAEGTVTRTMDSREWSDVDSMDLSFDYDNPLLITSYESFIPDYTATCTDSSGRTGECTIYAYGGMKDAVIDISGEEIVVKWE